MMKEFLFFWMIKGFFFFAIMNWKKHNGPDYHKMAKISVSFIS